MSIIFPKNNINQNKLFVASNILSCCSCIKIYILLLRFPLFRVRVGRLCFICFNVVLLSNVVFVVGRRAGSRSGRLCGRSVGRFECRLCSLGVSWSASRNFWKVLSTQLRLRRRAVAVRTFLWSAGGTFNVVLMSSYFRMSSLLSDVGRALGSFVCVVGRWYI